MRKEHYLRGKPRNTHFRSWEAWRKYNAYLHMHHIKHARANFVTINGRRHKVHCHKCV